MTDTKAKAERTSDPLQLAEEMESVASGYDEWRLQDPKTGVYTVAFDHRSYADPEREARQALHIETTKYPNGIYAGWEVACVRAQTERDVYLEKGAAELRRLQSEVERERKARQDAQIRQEELTAEVCRLEPMRQRAADIERLTAERGSLRAELAAARDSLDKIADIAHCGGWASMTNDESMIACRRLTLPYWNPSKDKGATVKNIGDAMRKAAAIDEARSES